MKRWFSLLAVLGLAIGCGESTPVATPVPSPEASSAPAVTDVVVDGDSGSVELQTIALKVPSMHCPFGRWPNSRMSRMSNWLRRRTRMQLTTLSYSSR